MRFFPTFLAILACCATGARADERPYVNDLPAPEGRKDLEAIQSALVEALPQAREATVCIEIGEGSGSGVIVSPDGLVLTAAHVSGGVGKEVTVVLEDGKKLKAKTLGLESETDAAMIQIEEEGTYPFVEIDRDSSTRLGDWVFAIGHSGGFDKDRGSVVRVGRIVRIAHSTIQSDCSLIGGDSGGPLFDLTGCLIGIHSRVGMALAENNHVPMTEYTRNWDALKNGEFIGEGPFAKKPVKGSGFLGLATESHPKGLRVMKVGKKTPAEDAGVKEGDVITSFNGKNFKDRKELQDELKEMAADDEVILEIERGDETKTLTFHLGER